MLSIVTIYSTIEIALGEVLGQMAARNPTLLPISYL